MFTVTLVRQEKWLLVSELVRSQTWNERSSES